MSKMDVTALLNGNTLPIEQRKDVMEELRLPTRNRTPWDAGGYSLPFNTAISPTESTYKAAKAVVEPNAEGGDCKMVATAPTSPTRKYGIHHVFEGGDSSRTMTPAPTSPIHHKFTDSRSSLSSFSSSLHSTTHSRLSSISTVNSCLTLSNAFSAQSLSPRSTTSQSNDMRSLPTDGSSGEPRPTTSKVPAQPENRLTPTEPLDTLALVASHYQFQSARNNGASIYEREPSPHSNDFESPYAPGRADRLVALPNFNHNIASSYNNKMGRTLFVDGNGEVNAKSRRDSPQYNDQGEEEGLKINSLKNSTPVNDRSASPSDSLLIKRLPPPLSTNNNPMSNMELPARDRFEFASQQQLFVSPSNAVPSSPQAYQAQINPVHSHTTAYPQTRPSLDHSEPPLLQSDNTLVDDRDRGENEDDEYGVKPTCLYVENCATKSTLRKVISHIFGRNKMCTRLIPNSIWVHLCRKHYQRSRYRNPTDYAKVQCDLVQDQIRRIHAWSVANTNAGHGAFIQSWTIVLRKREAKRMETAKKSTSKRKRADIEEEVEDGSDDGDSAGHPTPITAPPEWLLHLTGGQFDTDTLVDIVNRLHQHMIDNTVPFPDIEILPTVCKRDDDDVPYESNIDPESQLRVDAQRKVRLRQERQEQQEQEHQHRNEKRRRPNGASVHLYNSTSVGETRQDNHIHSSFHSPSHGSIAAPAPPPFNPPSMLPRPEDLNTHRSGAHLRTRSENTHIVRHESNFHGGYPTTMHNLSAGPQYGRRDGLASSLDNQSSYSRYSNPGSANIDSQSGTSYNPSPGHQLGTSSSITSPLDKQPSYPHPFGADGAGGANTHGRYEPSQSYRPHPSMYRPGTTNHSRYSHSYGGSGMFDRLHRQDEDRDDTESNVSSIPAEPRSKRPPTENTLRPSATATRRPIYE